MNMKWVYHNETHENDRSPSRYRRRCLEYEDNVIQVLDVELKDEVEDLDLVHEDFDLKGIDFHTEVLDVEDDPVNM